MEGKMKEAVFTELKKIELRETDIPKIGGKDVLVKVKHIGICGSDLHFYEYGRIGDFIIEYPFLLGHEAGGEVVEVGKEVQTLAVGDLVALEPGIACGKCKYCKEGKYNLCPDVRFLAAPPTDGCMKEYIVFPEDMCFKLKDGMNTLQGAMIEPLSVGLHAVSQSGYRLGNTAVVLGCGCIGLCTMLSLRAAGITDVLVADIVDSRLEKAKELGATRVVNTMKEDLRKAVEEFSPTGADLVFETAGAVKTVQETAYITKRGGTIILVGMGAESLITYDIGSLIFNEISIKTVFRYRNLYPVAINLVANKKIAIEKVVTDVFRFEDSNHAFEECIANKNSIVKGVIEL